MTNRTAIAITTLVFGLPVSFVGGAMFELERNRQSEAQCKAMLGTYSALPNGGWKYEHIWMPACPDNLKRTVDAPEKDEVDAITVNCGVQP